MTTKKKKLDLIGQQLKSLHQIVNEGINSFCESELSNQSSIDGLSESEICLFSKKIELCIKTVLEKHFLQIESLVAIYNALPNLKHLPSTRGWAGSPDFLSKVIELVLREKPFYIVEAGSGVSTIVTGLALQLNTTGKVVSLEHSSPYENSTLNNIRVNQIESFTNVIDAPLRDYLIDGKIWLWYDVSKIIPSQRIDMLIVDGPPGSIQSLARYPAVPLLHKYFSTNTFILLDDSERDDEKLVVGMWFQFLESRGFQVEITRYDHFEKGLVVLKVLNTRTI